MTTTYTSFTKRVNDDDSLRCIDKQHLPLLSSAAFDIVSIMRVGGIVRAYILFILLFVCTMAMGQTKERHRFVTGAFASVNAGYSISLAENASKSDAVAHQLPSIGATVGYDFSPTVSARMDVGVLSQVSRCSDAVLSLMPDVYGDGRYKFHAISGGVSALVNLTNLFYGYDAYRDLTWSVIAGCGGIVVEGFEKEKIAQWNEYDYYPVNPDGGVYPTANVGVQCAVRLSAPLDLTIELRGNATSNAYNGVDNGNALDFYADVMIGASYHFARKGIGEKKRKSPVAAPQVSVADEAAKEHYAKGRSMQTTVPFYPGFYYLNTVTQKHVAAVAIFLKQHPDVRVCIVGHPDVVVGEDEESNIKLATRRAETVQKALVEKCGIEPHRLSVKAENTTLSTFRNNNGEWTPAVEFVME